MKKIFVGLTLIMATLHAPRIYTMDQHPSLLSRCLRTCYNDRILFGAGGLALYVFDSPAAKAIATACVVTLYTCAKFAAAPITVVTIPEVITPARTERQKNLNILGFDFTVALR